MWKSFHSKGVVPSFQWLTMSTNKQDGRSNMIMTCKMWHKQSISLTTEWGPLICNTTQSRHFHHPFKCKIARPLPTTFNVHQSTCLNVSQISQGGAIPTTAILVTHCLGKSVPHTSCFSSKLRPQQTFSVSQWQTALVLLVNFSPTEFFMGVFSSEQQSRHSNQLDSLLALASHPGLLPVNK